MGREKLGEKGGVAACVGTVGKGGGGQEAGVVSRNVVKVRGVARGAEAGKWRTTLKRGPPVVREKKKGGEFFRTESGVISEEREGSTNWKRAGPKNRVGQT